MDIDRLKAIVLYVLNSVPEKYLGKHELFKILYFANQKHLIRYGNAIITDFYAFQHGPVPSSLLNYLNGRNTITSSLSIDAETKYVLSPKEKPDMDELSKSEVECLNESIKENGGLSFIELTNKSHDSAWRKAWSNPVGKRGGKMGIVDIAIAANADDQIIKYIKEDIELEAALK